MIAEAVAAHEDWRALLSEARQFLMPEIILTVFGCLALVLDAILPRAARRIIAWSALVGVALSAASVASIYLTLAPTLPRLGFYRMLVVDEFSLAFKGIFLLALALSIVLSIRFLDQEAEQRGDFYSLMLFATVGMMFLAGSFDLLALYISLELMAISVYVLVGYMRRSRASNEAALKYFLLGAFSSGVLLYGMSLLYGLTGTTNLADIAERIPALLAGTPTGGDPRFLLLIAVCLLVAGLAFKVAAAPFHVWAPDAYEGAPTPVTAFMSVGVKAAGFAFFARLFLEGIPGLRSIGGAEDLPGWGLLLGAVAAIAMTWGNVAALTQTNAKRLFAYSSVSHAGFLLLGVVAGNRTGYAGLVIYLFVYVAMNLGAFGVLLALKRDGVEGDRIDAFRGLGSRAPGLAALMTIFLLSLGGIPPTAGFIGKFYVFSGLIQTGEPWLARLAVLAVLNTAVSAYYYLLFVKAMYLEEASDEDGSLRTAPTIWASVAVAAVLTLAIGVYPQPIIEWSNKAVERFKPARSTPVRKAGTIDQTVQ